MLQMCPSAFYFGGVPCLSLLYNVYNITVWGSVLYDDKLIVWLDTVRSACKLRARRTEYKSVFFQTT